MTPKLSDTSTITQSLSPYLDDFIDTHEIQNCARGHACLYGYIFEVDLKWGERIQGPLSEWKHHPGEQWVNVELQPLTFGVLERIAC
jgi:hypothetical protein